MSCYSHTLPIPTHLAIDVFKVLDAVAEGHNLGGAHKSEVQGVKEQHGVLALQALEAYILELQRAQPMCATKGCVCAGGRMLVRREQGQRMAGV